MSVQAIDKPKEDIYVTSDQMMCEVLMMAGHTAVRVRQTAEGTLEYLFDVETVWPTVEGILTGNAAQMTFSYLDWWKAKTTWTMNLRHCNQRKK